jgi:NAD(P)-dependent dehydrogenase (short-subunit alcohol dehydrogenase family)
MKADAFRYDGKRAVVVGGATGMGAATAELVQDLGGEVVVMDIAEVTTPGVKTIHLNLADRGSVESAVDECGGPIDALFCCAGVADGTPGIERINFIGHRHLIDRCLDKGLLPAGSSIGMISSAAGLAWERFLPEIQEVLDIPDWDAAVRWFEEHNKRDYMSTKQVMCSYVNREAFAMQKRGVRINAILPGPTDTPLARSNEDLWLAFGADYREAAGIEASRADEQAGPLAFLCSDAASYVNGVILIVDAGYTASGLTGSFADATPPVEFLYGRY